jgi:hypothetical protein
MIGMDKECDRVPGHPHGFSVDQPDPVWRGAISAVAPILKQVTNVDHDGAGNGVGAGKKVINFCSFKSFKSVWQNILIW